MNSPDEEIFPLRAPYPSIPKSPNDPFVIMYHGSLVERNGLDLAVSALAQARESVPSAELRVYGRKTPFLERVMEDVRARGLSKSVHYLGAKRLEDLASAIDECDVGVIPNQQNAFTEINTPTRIFEYLALASLSSLLALPAYKIISTQAHCCSSNPVTLETWRGRWSMCTRTCRKRLRLRKEDSKSTWRTGGQKKKKKLVNVVAELLVCDRRHSA